MTKRDWWWAVVPAVVAYSLASGSRLSAEFPYPANPRPCGASQVDEGCIEARDFAAYLFLPEATPPLVPNDFTGGSSWKLGSGQTGNPEIDSSPQELFGVTGSSVDRAWQVTTGRPDVLIAVLDSGIRWHRQLPDLVGKFYLNRGELPIPENSSNEFDPWDRNRDGVFNVRDYEASGGWPQDSRVGDANGNGLLDPEDLIFLFSDGRDDDGNGYVDDISGWDFFEDDNDPLDEVEYGHGTGEAHDSTAEANNGGSVGTCPNCMALMVRVGDSFVAEVNAFARGVLFAVDSGASVIQEALGTLNHSSFGQAAIDYAYRRGVVVIASAADEESRHHNFPAAYERTVVVNSVTRFASIAGLTMEPQSYLYLNGCTNYGPQIALAVPSTACSSEATGLASGIAGLVQSAARNEVDRGRLTRYRTDTGKFAPYALSANEVKQLLIQSADDINFDARPDLGLPQNYQVSLALPQGIQSARFPSIAGFDQYFGYGRINARRAVELVREARIPPEAELWSPKWFTIVSPDQGSLEVEGRVAANRSQGFHWELAVAPGVQPAESDFVIVATGEEERARAGILGRIDLVDLAARMPHGAEGPPVAVGGQPDPDRYTVTVRLRVRDATGNFGEDRRAWFLHRDRDAFPGTPKRLGSDGAAAPVFVDVTGDGADDLVVATSEGTVHLFTGADLQEPPGWPVHTDPMEVHLDSPAFRSGELSVPHAPILGMPAVGDLDRDGQVEIVAADLYGKVYVWQANGQRRPGFPVRTHLEFSFPLRSEREQLPDMRLVPDRIHRLDPDNRLARGFVAGPVLGNLDSSEDGSLEIIAGAMDRHVYAWFSDGRPVPGWPVLLKDPTKVLSVDPVTNRVQLAPGAGQRMGTKIIVPPSLGDLDGDGRLEVVAAVNEAYRERMSAVITNVVLNFLQVGGALEGGNTRVYAIDSAGTNRGSRPVPFGWNAEAFLPGWPVKLAMLTTELLPVVGTGSNGPAALADLDRDGKLEVAASSMLGPAYIFRATGESFLGNAAGTIPRTLAADVFGPGSPAVDGPSYPALGAVVLAEMLGPGQGFQALAPTAGLGKLLDANLPARQFPAENHLAMWDVMSEGRLADVAKFRVGYPHVVNDLQFFVAPVAADITGDGIAEAIAGSGVFDLYAVDAFGAEAPGWPKFTGGWSIGSPAVGDLDADGRLEVAAVTREGGFFIFRTQGRSCGHIPWRQYHHDPWSTGNYHTDAWLPAPPFGSVSLVGENVVVLSGPATPGDDSWCGAPARIELRASLEPVVGPDSFERATLLPLTSPPQAAGRDNPLRVGARLPEGVFGRLYFAARTEDEAGNRSRIVDLGVVEVLAPSPTQPKTATPSSTMSPLPTPTEAPTATSTATLTATLPPPTPTVNSRLPTPTRSAVGNAAAHRDDSGACAVVGDAENDRGSVLMLFLVGLAIAWCRPRQWWGIGWRKPNCTDA
ncbi:MAG: S8 family serine peptidase [Candidatus Binatia bacterium]|nr:S8 family serine peptidase [Candidatus Binatia bacterium]